VRLLAVIPNPLFVSIGTRRLDAAQVILVAFVGAGLAPLVATAGVALYLPALFWSICVATDFSENGRAFLEGEVMLLTLNGALSTRDRNFKVYCDGLDTNHKKKIRERICEKLKSLHDIYEAPCSEKAHVDNIWKLADDLTHAFGEELHDSRFRIGVSQKLLNLYLKYRWVLGWISEPCHCPFDSVIIEKLHLAKRVNWTALDSVDDYWALVDAARKASADARLSIAEWELANFERR